MTFDYFKSKTMKDQPDQGTNGGKANGLRCLSSHWWCPVAVTLGILCVGLLVSIILLSMQLSQVTDLLKQQQANLTQQENILEGQSLAQKQEEKASLELQRKLKGTIANLTQELDETSKKQMELLHQNLNLQEDLKKAANFSGGNVFAEGCILTAYSICQRKATLLRAQ
uniref:Oxidized low density lipoprotein receptor 1 n=1 Tax=Pipistrellus kuhlii TaxID=59472 RepID=A0A7J7ZKY4_PIPKU|nr:oxidized low density lipoprotein receptor 1 [Pipistrellus kuhlii]